MIPVIGISGFSGAGKTTLIEKLIPLLKPAFPRIAIIKSTHHTIELDQRGKDSFRYRDAGADTVLLNGPTSLQLWQTREHADSQNLTKP